MHFKMWSAIRFNLDQSNILSSGNRLSPKSKRCLLVIWIIVFQKNGRDFEKLQKALKPDELSATLSCMSLEQRHQYLEKAYQEHLEMYEHVIERLNRD